MISQLTLLALRFKSDELAILLGKDQNQEPYRSLTSKIRVGSRVDLNKLSAEFDGWYVDSSAYNKQMKAFFKDPNSLL
ncbi:hypothetical protein QT986_33865 [Microcoleus sp. herbarium14]